MLDTTYLQGTGGIGFQSVYHANNKFQHALVLKAKIDLVCLTPFSVDEVSTQIKVKVLHKNYTTPQRPLSRTV